LKAAQNLKQQEKQEKQENVRPLLSRVQLLTGCDFLGEDGFVWGGNSTPGVVWK